MKKTILLLAVMTVGSLSMSYAKDNKREALIIANKNYEWEQPLKNPVNDAGLIKKSLENLGFNVVVETDIDIRNMNKAIKDFKKRLLETQANIGVFYYAGHGVQNSEGKNFLVPLGAEMESLDDVDVESYPADKLMKQIQKSNVDVSMVFLDACRNQPYPASVSSGTRGSYRGLAKMDIGIKNTLVMYSTAAGALASDGDGDYSPFAIAVDEALKKPGRPLQNIPIVITKKVTQLTDGKQMPFSSLQLDSEDIVIHTADNSNDSVAWEAARDCNTLACYQAYLSDYPNGKNRQIATAIIAKIQVAQSSDEQSSGSEQQVNEQGQSPKEKISTNIDYDNIVNTAFSGKKLSNKQISILQENGDNPKSQAILSILYEWGTSVEKDLDKAFRLAQASAETGEPLGMMRLSYFYRTGQGVEKSDEKSLYWIEKAVKFKNAHAYRNMGHYYNELENPDYTKAKHWYEKAVAMDDATAESYLGMMYIYGYGVKQDYDKALQLLTRSAEQGSIEGEFNLGNAYNLGLGVARDYDKALDWYHKAAVKGHPMAQNNIGVSYQYGKGVKKDVIQAMYWFQKSAEQGNGLGMQNIGSLYRDGQGVSTDYDKAMQWYQKAVDAGDHEALSQIGYMYVRGLGVRQSYREAMHWFEKAADKGVGVGMRNMGVLYERGLGVRRNYAKAAQLYAKAFKAGDYNIRTLQFFLNSLNCGAGSEDGKWGGRTQQALRRLIQFNYETLGETQAIPTMETFGSLSTAKELNHCIR